MKTTHDLLWPASEAHTARNMTRTYTYKAHPEKAGHDRHLLNSPTHYWPAFLYWAERRCISGHLQAGSWPR